MLSMYLKRLRCRQSTGGSCASRMRFCVDNGGGSVCVLGGGVGGMGGVGEFGLGRAARPGGGGAAGGAWGQGARAQKLEDSTRWMPEISCTDCLHVSMC